MDPGEFPHNERVDIRNIVDRVIFPDDPVLARRILALLWAYERGALQHRVLTEPLHRYKRTGTDSDAQRSVADVAP